MYIVVGLGNPGTRYQETRHNVGFKTIDILSAQLNIDIIKKRFGGHTGEGSFEGSKIILLKPQTYMNLSGESVYEAASWYKIPLSRIILVYDDVDLPVGKIRVKPNGSAGTHNGMRSVVGCMQSENIPRVRIGIGAPGIREFDLGDYVLGRFSADEKPEMEKSLENAAEAVKVIIKDGIEAAMNRFNG